MGSVGDGGKIGKIALEATHTPVSDISLVLGFNYAY